MICYKKIAIGLCFAVLENAITGNCCENYPARFKTLQPPFYFAYMSINSDYNLIVKLKNVSRNITAVKVAVKEDGPVSKYNWSRYNYEGEYFKVCGTARSSKVTISLELYSSNGLCARRLVSEGRNVMTLEYGLADSTYKSDHYCLDIPKQACGIEMDLRHDCIESETHPNASRKISNVKPKLHNSTTPKPTISYTPKSIPNIPGTVRNTTRKQNRRIPDTPKPTQSTSDVSRNASRIPKPAISYTPKTALHIPDSIQNTSPTPNHKIFVTPKPAQNNKTRISTTPKPVISHTPKAPQNISNTSKSTHNITDDHNKNTINTSEAALNTLDSQQEARNIPVTTSVTRVTSDSSNEVDFRTDVAYSERYTKLIVISSAVSVLALILLVVVIRKCCWIKRNPSASPQLLTNDLGDSPFYLNMLFRKECDGEIERIEQHHYEEINAQ